MTDDYKLLGLSGASGSGKTTLGLCMSKEFGIPFVPTSITKMANDLGYSSPVVNLSLTDRIKLQYGLLDEMTKLLEKAPRPCIIDRTPIDLIAYLYAEIGMHSLAGKQEELAKKVDRFYNLCIDLAEEHLNIIYCLELLPNYETNAKRPPAGLAYQLHCQCLIKGALNDCKKINSATVPGVSTEKRVELIYDHMLRLLAGNRANFYQQKICN